MGDFRRYIFDRCFFVNRAVLLMRVGSMSLLRYLPSPSDILIMYLVAVPHHRQSHQQHTINYTLAQTQGRNI